MYVIEADIAVSNYVCVRASKIGDRFFSYVLVDLDISGPTNILFLQMVNPSAIAQKWTPPRLKFSTVEL